MDVKLDVVGLHDLLSLNDRYFPLPHDMVAKTSDPHMIAKDIPVMIMTVWLKFQFKKKKLCYRRLAKRF